MRENNFVETYKFLSINRERLAEEAEKRIQESANAREKFVKDYHSIIESREVRARRHGKYLEACKNDALSTALKAIYITALEANTLTDEGLILAENMVDGWIQENGGATKILNSCKNNTYLLSRLSQIVEDAAEDAVKDAENVEDDKDDKKEEEKEDSKETKDKEETSDDEPSQKELKNAISIIKKNAGKDEEVKNALDILMKKAEVNSDGEDESESSEEDSEKSDENGEDPLNDTDFEDDNNEESEDNEDDDKEDEDNKSESKDEESESSEEDSEKSDEKDPLNDTDFEDDNSEESEDNEDDETDIADDIADGAEEEDINIDGTDDESSKGKVFDELEKEDDVKKAIKLIRQRVADAEQSFIKKNAEDKKQIDELIGRISDNVKTVEDLNDEDSKETKVAEESARMNKRKINEITNNRPLTVLEKMTRNLHAGIIKDEVVKEQYTTESGKLDTGMIVESAKVMYAFLETINTLQLQKVDSKYIQKVLSEM